MQLNSQDHQKALRLCQTLTAQKLFGNQTLLFHFHRHQGSRIRLHIHYQLRKITEKIMSVRNMRVIRNINTVTLLFAQHTEHYSRDRHFLLVLDVNTVTYTLPSEKDNRKNHERTKHESNMKHKHSYIALCLAYRAIQQGQALPTRVRCKHSYMYITS